MVWSKTIFNGIKHCCEALQRCVTAVFLRYASVLS